MKFKLKGEKLDIFCHELSRTINIASKRTLNDFVNEYDMKEARKMQYPV